MTRTILDYMDNRLTKNNFIGLINEFLSLSFVEYMSGTKGDDGTDDNSHTLDDKLVEELQKNGYILCKEVGNPKWNHKILHFKRVDYFIHIRWLFNHVKWFLTRKSKLDYTKSNLFPKNKPHETITLSGILSLSDEDFNKVRDNITHTTIKI